LRVKLSYSADIEEVPEEISKLFTYVELKANAVRAQVGQLDILLEDEDIETSLSLISKLRITLGEMDQRLSDLEFISEGYVNFIEQSKGASNDTTERRPSMAAPSSPVVPRDEQPPSGEVE